MGNGLKQKDPFSLGENQTFLDLGILLYSNKITLKKEFTTLSTKKSLLQILKKVLSDIGAPLNNIKPKELLHEIYDLYIDTCYSLNALAEIQQRGLVNQFSEEIIYTLPKRRDLRTLHIGINKLNESIKSLKSNEKLSKIAKEHKQLLRLSNNNQNRISYGNFLFKHYKPFKEELKKISIKIYEIEDQINHLHALT